MLAADLAVGRDAAADQAALLGEGLVVNVPTPGVLRMLPPLVIEQAEADAALEILAGVLD
jgi:acetylornithine aminotransferase